jgi:hypothetical protein
MYYASTMTIPESSPFAAWNDQLGHGQNLSAMPSMTGP